MPKLQAGCTLTAQDGMVVRTARTSAKAAEGQNATLEFILVNHPLDCPVCDKGGECPLQDLTFRYGPGKTRMNFEKTTFEKPIPISPTIALDRERCILCYRCTRFSEDVERGRPARRAQPRRDVDHHDVRGRAVQRRRSPATSPSSAPSARSCRRSTASRRARGRSRACRPSAACARSAATRRSTCARARRSASARGTTTRSTKAGSATRAASRSRTCAPTDRIVDPIKRVRRRGFEPVSWDDAIDTAEELLRAAHGRVVVALSGSETIEQAYALAKLVRQGTDSHDAVLPEEVSGALDAYRLPLSAIADAQVVAVLGDVPLAESAPIVDLWVRKARRNGARIVTSEGRREGRRPHRPHLVGPGRPRRRARRAARREARPRRQGRLRRLLRARDAERPRRRRRLGGGLRRGARRLRVDRPADRLGRRGRRRPERARPRRARRRRDRDLDVPRPRRRLGRPRPPGHELPRARRHLREHRRPPAAPAPHRGAARARRARVARRSSRPASTSSSRRMRRRSSPRSPSAATAASRSPRSASAPPCAPTRARLRTPTSRRCRSPQSRPAACASSATSRSSRGPRSSASRSCSSSGRRPRSSSRAADAEAARHRDRRRGHRVAAAAPR